MSEMKNDITMLNMNFPIRAIEAGKLKIDDVRKQRNLKSNLFVFMFF